MISSSYITIIIRIIQGFIFYIYIFFFEYKWWWWMELKKGANGIWYYEKNKKFLSTSCVPYSFIHSLCIYEKNMNEVVYKKWIHNRCNFHKNPILIFFCSFHAQLRFHLNFNHVPLPLKLFRMTTSEILNNNSFLTSSLFRLCVWNKLKNLNFLVFTLSRKKLKKKSLQKL